MDARLLERLTLLHDIPNRDEFVRTASSKVVGEGQWITLEGDVCHAFSFVVDGTVRVYKIGETGREITLYRLEAGDSCILTASCILSRNRFPATAMAETQVIAVTVPSDVFRSWTHRYEFWREYVYHLMSKRMADVIALVEEVVFRQMDRRVADYLIRRSSNRRIDATHQEIAADLGTSREVVSRILKDFEELGAVRLGRGIIELADAGKLRNREIL